VSRKFVTLCKKKSATSALTAANYTGKDGGAGVRNACSHKKKKKRGYGTGKGWQIEEKSRRIVLCENRKTIQKAKQKESQLEPTQNRVKICRHQPRLTKRS